MSSAREPAFAYPRARGAGLETPRLRLRRLDEGDFGELLAMFNDPKVMRFYLGLKDEMKTQAWLNWVAESYEKHGFGLWAVVRKSDGEFLGQCGLVQQVVEGTPEVEVGYLLKSAHWHQGYATEAAAGCRDFALG